MRVPLPAIDRLIRDIVERLLWFLRDELGEVARRGAQRGFVARRDHEWKLASLRQRGRRDRIGVVALENHVRVGAAEAEGIHADDEPAARAQRPIGGHDIQIPVVERNLRIGIIHADMRRNDPVAQRIEHLDEARDARCGLEMPDIAFDRADRQRIGAQAMPAQRVAQGAGLDRIADRRAGAMRLDVVDLRGIDSGMLIGAREQRRLGRRTRHRDAGFASVGVDGRVRDQRKNWIAVGNCAIKILEQETRRRLRSVRSRRPRRRRRGSGLVATASKPWKKKQSRADAMQADGARERLGDLARHDRAVRLVEGNQGRGARGVDRHARAAQVEEIRQAIGRDTRGIAGREGGINRRHVVGHAPRIIGGRNSDEHAAVAAANGLGRIPAFSNVSQAISSNKRCCGSMSAASRGEIAKKPASNPDMSPIDPAANV